MQDPHAYSVCLSFISLTRVKFTRRHRASRQNLLGLSNVGPSGYAVMVSEVRRSVSRHQIPIRKGDARKISMGSIRTIFIGPPKIEY